MSDLRQAAQQALEAWGDLPWYQQPTALYPQMNALRAALAQQAEQQPMHPELQKMWEDHIDKCFRAIPVPEQAEPVVRGAAYADALRWTIKACGAVQRHDGVWFGDDAAARLARVLSEGIAPPQQAEPVQEPVAWEGWWLHHGQHNYRAKPLTSERVKELMKLAFEVGREAAPPQREPLTEEEIDRIRAAEREACAVAAAAAAMDGHDYESIAAVIRARSKLC